jgi:cell division transport system permease protein
MQYLEPLFSALTVATYIAVGIAALMLIAAVLLIATTIRLSAYARRREVGIMRLVGASNRFIQTPFILEGVFAAFIGSLLAGGDPRRCALRSRGYLRDRVTFITDWVGVGCRGRHPDHHRDRPRARRALGGLRDPPLVAGLTPRAPEID